MSKLGADPASLRRLASRLEAAGESLDDDGAVLSRRMRSIAWHGQDAQRYVAEWDATHRPLLRDVASTLTVTARHLRDEARAQERASDATGSLPGVGVVADMTGGTAGFGEKSVVTDWVPTPPTWVGQVTGAAAAATGLAEVKVVTDALADQRSLVAAANGLQEASLLNGVPSVGELAGGAGKVFGVAGRVFGVADLAFNVWNLADGIEERDGGQIADGLIGGSLAAASLLLAATSPVGWAVVGAGAVWTGLGFVAGSLGYETTSDMLWDGITWVGDGVADLATGAWQGVEDAAGAVAEAGQDFLDAAGAALDTIGGWFD